jgi:hypothetical protein
MVMRVLDRMARRAKPADIKGVIVVIVVSLNAGSLATAFLTSVRLFDVARADGVPQCYPRSVLVWIRKLMNPLATNPHGPRDRGQPLTGR